MSNTFNIKNRFTDEFNNSEEYDIIIIGGGITGAGIALNAAQNGFKTLLLEKNDFSSGTSSRSTKLIHGGLRYLKELEFKLVHDVARERKVVYENARHLVRPERMLLPIYKKGSLSWFSTLIALWTYDKLGGVEKQERRKMLDTLKCINKEPLLKQEGLQGGGMYYEYRTDDARLNIEVIKTAVLYGAKCYNYCEVKAFIYNENKEIVGVKIENKLNAKELVFMSKIVINATGPWVDNLRNIDNSLKGKKITLTKGVHLVFPYDKIPVSQALYFDSTDKRMIFVIPRNNKTYVGTTDTLYSEGIDNPRVTKRDVDYLIKNIRNTLNVEITQLDVNSSWAGLRPLIYEEGKSPSELSRKDEIFISKTGLVSIAGGKLTGYRKMAEDVLSSLLNKQKLETKVLANTKQTKLIGAEFNNEKEMIEFICVKTEENKIHNISQIQIEDWVYKYGRETERIIEKALSLEHSRKSRENIYILAELYYCIENESIYTLSDFLIRRTGMLYFEREKINIELCKLLNTELGIQLNKSEEENKMSFDEFQKYYIQAVSFS